MAKASEKPTKKTTSKNSKKAADTKTTKAAKEKNAALLEAPEEEIVIEHPKWSKKKGRRRHERKIRILEGPIRLDPAIDAKYVADVIDFEKDIEPFKVIEIVSGVGSGKNYWVQNELAKKYRVLEVTSRRKTADAQAAFLDAADKLRKVETIAERRKKVDKLFKDLNDICVECTETLHKDAVITYYQMELYCKYSDSNTFTRLADFFDSLIFDEFHATIQDAGFQTSSPAVYNFISQCIKEGKAAKIILMTATPGPVKKWLSKIEEKVGKTYYNPIDLYDECHHVITKQVVMHPYVKVDDVLNIDLNLYRRKVIYFTHTVSNACEIVHMALLMGVPEEKIGIDFADDYYGMNDETVDGYAIPQKILDNRKRIRESLKPKEDKAGNQVGELIPDDIQFFVSTGVNREGINIRNKDIDSVYIESMNNCEVNQLLGRLRNGVRCAHLLFGYKEVGENPGMRLFIMDYNHSAVDGVQKAYRKYGPRPGSGKNAHIQYVDNIMERFEYIAWNGGYFAFNWQKSYEHELRAQDILDLKWARNHWDKGEAKKIEAKEGTKVDETSTCEERAEEYFKLADGYELDDALLGYSEDEIKQRIEENSDNPVSQAQWQEILGRKEELTEKKKKERDYGDITGSQLLQTYWFPYSEILLDPSLYYESIADFKYIIEAVNRTMNPKLGKIISKAEYDNLKQELEIALYNRGTGALAGIASRGYLSSIDKEGNEKTRNLSKHKQTVSVLNLFGYTIEDTSHKKGEAGKNFLVRGWKEGDKWKPHDDVIRLSGVSDFGRPDIEADMNIETFGELIDKGLVVMPPEEKPGLSSMFYDPQKVAEAFPEVDTKGTKKKPTKKATKKQK